MRGKAIGAITQPQLDRVLESQGIEGRLGFRVQGLGLRI
jgi:hypothetical protein